MFGKLNIANMVLDGVSRMISIAPAKCTRIKHKSSPCDLCHTNCPAQAIDIGGPGMTIRVDWDKCTGCGICVNVCPTQAYTLRNNGYKEMIDACCRAITPDGTLNISCAEAEVEKGVPAAAMQCVGILNAVDILLLYVRGARKIVFRIGDCDDCESKNGEKVVCSALDTLQELENVFEDLNGLSVEKKNNYISIEFPKQKPIARPKEPEKQNPALDRRGLFSFFTKNLKENAIKSVSIMSVEKTPPRTTITFDHYMPLRRTLFLESIMQLGNLTSTEVATGKLFNNIKIDERCVYCGVCARFCTTGALAIDDDRTEITFNPSKCTLCLLCEKACYHDKLHYKQTLDLKDFFSDIVVKAK